MTDEQKPSSAPPPEQTMHPEVLKALRLACRIENDQDLARALGQNEQQAREFRRETGAQPPRR